MHAHPCSVESEDLVLPASSPKHPRNPKLDVASKSARVGSGGSPRIETLGVEGLTSRTGFVSFQ